jgi:sugar lactone lactonase YvrE
MSFLRLKKGSRLARVFAGLAAFVLTAQTAGFAASSWANNQNATTVLGQSGFTQANAGVGPGSFFQPGAARFDAVSGKLFVTDCVNNRIVRFAGSQAVVTGGTGEAAFGQSDLVSSLAGTTQSKVNCPGEVFVDSAERLWVADTTNNRVLRWDSADAALSGQPATVVLGQPNFTTSTAGTSATKMAYPEGIFVDAAGNLWVADSGNNRVLRFFDAANKPSGAAADSVLGQPDLVTATPAMSATGLAAPNSIVGSGTTLWISDSGNNRVLRFDNAASKPNGSNADGVLGSSVFTSVPSNRTTASTFDTPGGLAIDPTPRLYVADTANNRVLIFSNPLGTGVSASNVLGQPNFTDNTPRLTQSGFDTPYAPTWDNGSQSLWVADLGNNRVLRFNPQVATAGSVSVSGRVTDRSGTGLRNVRVTFTDQSGTVKTAITNSYGFYTFNGLPAGSSYVGTVTARGYSFASRVVQAIDSLTDVDFAAQ